jgi:6-phosphogluconolactonase/glucosamine-6-phosphate isomerase/deaminase
MITVSMPLVLKRYYGSVNLFLWTEQNVVTFNMDEYVGLDPSHPQSYRSFMHENCQSQLSGRGHVL